MVFDVKLKGNAFIVLIHKAFFENELLKSFQEGNRLTETLLSYLGQFIISEKEFGFGGCLKKVFTDEKEGGYLYYEFDFPNQTINFLEYQKINVLSVAGDDSLKMRQFMMTVHICGHYALEDMRFNKCLFGTNAWEDQMISFNLHDNHNGAGYSIAGKTYKGFNRRYVALDEEKRNELEKYIHKEMKRCCMYFSGQELSYEQIHILDNSWYIQCDSGGRWANSDKGINPEKICEFSSHNIDHRIDQLKLFCAIIAMSTWFRENMPTV